MEIKETAKVSWRKSKRMLLLKLSFLCAFIGFALGYIGGLNNNTALIAAAFAVWGIAALLPILIKK